MSASFRWLAGRFHAKSQGYRYKAAECLRMAQTPRPRHDRRLYLSMANSWLSLAAGVKQPTRFEGHDGERTLSGGKIIGEL